MRRAIAVIDYRMTGGQGVMVDNAEILLHVLANETKGMMKSNDDHENHYVWYQKFPATPRGN